MLKSSANTYSGEDAIAKYALVLTYNTFSSPKDKINVVNFSKRCRVSLTKTNKKGEILPAWGLTDDEIRQAQDMADEMIAGIKAAESQAIESQSSTPQEPGIDYNHIAQEIRQSYSVISWNDTLYRYQNGIYVKDNGFLETVIVGKVLNVLGTGGEEKITIIANQVRHYLKYTEIENEYPFNNYPNLIPVRNGIVDIGEDPYKILDFAPGFKFNYRLNVEYVKNADIDPPTKYLESLGVDTNLLLQIPANAILGMLGSVYKKAYFIDGDPDSGKSVFLDLNSARLFGRSVCSSISLQSLMNDTFQPAGLDGKVINCYADLSDQKITDIGIFKALTGGDDVNVQRKFKDPYSLKNKALLVFSANKYPRILVSDPAFWKRWISIEFPKSFASDPDFAENTFTDDFISGYFRLVLDRLKTIRKEGLMLTDNVETKWLNDASSSHRFIKECLIKNTDAVLVKQPLFKTYCDYCLAGGYEIESNKAFTLAMGRNGALTDKRFKINGKQEHCYQGFSEKDGKPVLADPETEQSGKQAEPQKNTDPAQGVLNVA